MPPAYSLQYYESGYCETFAAIQTLNTIDEGYYRIKVPGCHQIVNSVCTPLQAQTFFTVTKVTERYSPLSTYVEPEMNIYVTPQGFASLPSPVTMNVVYTLLCDDIHLQSQRSMELTLTGCPYVVGNLPDLSLPISSFSEWLQLNVENPGSGFLITANIDWFETNEDEFRFRPDLSSTIQIQFYNVGIYFQNDDCNISLAQAIGVTITSGINTAPQFLTSETPFVISQYVSEPDTKTYTLPSASDINMSDVISYSIDYENSSQLPIYFQFNSQTLEFTIYTLLIPQLPLLKTFNLIATDNNSV